VVGIKGMAEAKEIEEHSRKQEQQIVAKNDYNGYPD